MTRSNFGYHTACVGAILVYTRRICLAYSLEAGGGHLTAASPPLSIEASNIFIASVDLVVIIEFTESAFTYIFLQPWLLLLNVLPFLRLHVHGDRLNGMLKLPIHPRLYES
jgi:hypothetical protein